MQHSDKERKRRITSGAAVGSSPACCKTGPCAPESRCNTARVYCRSTARVFGRTSRCVAVGASAACGRLARKERMAFQQSETAEKKMACWRTGSTANLRNEQGTQGAMDWTWTWTWTRDLELGHVTWTWTWTRDLELGHVTWTWTRDLKHRGEDQGRVRAGPSREDADGRPEAPQAAHGRRVLGPHARRGDLRTPAAKECGEAEEEGHIDERLEEE
eukprot:5606898-Prymnesium_polylepis.2